MGNRQEPKQLWVVMDGENHWLWYGRGSQKDAVAGAKGAGAYTPEATLFLYAVAMEIVIEPDGVAQSIATI